MKNKTLEFVKNMAITTIPFVGGGIVGAELSDLVTDSDAIISSVSTASQYVLAYPAFIALHAHDNRDIYQDEGKWNKRKLAKDTLKIMFSLGIAEVAYIAGRTGLMDYFINKDFSPTPAAVIADSICIPLYIMIAVPIAKKVGIIRKSED